MIRAISSLLQSDRAALGESAQLKIGEQSFASTNSVLGTPNLSIFWGCSKWDAFCSENIIS